MDGRVKEGKEVGVRFQEGKEGDGRVQEKKEMDIEVLEGKEVDGRFK